MGTMQQVQKFATAERFKSPPQAAKGDPMPPLMRGWIGRQLAKLSDQRSTIAEGLRAIPDHMQKITNQARLVMELTDDYRSGAYRDVSWASLALAAGCLLYVVSPADLVPDALPGIGWLDDVIALSLAMRLMRQDLNGYLQFKGYNEKDYF